MEALRKNQPMIVFCIQLREAQNNTQVRTDINISFENKIAERARLVFHKINGSSGVWTRFGLRWTKRLSQQIFY